MWCVDFDEKVLSDIFIKVTEVFIVDSKTHVKNYKLKNMFNNLKIMNIRIFLFQIYLYGQIKYLKIWKDSYFS